MAFEEALGALRCQALVNLSYCAAQVFVCLLLGKRKVRIYIL